MCRCSFAWYSSTSKASASNAKTYSGALATAASTVSLGSVQIDFVVTPTAADPVQLSNVDGSNYMEKGIFIDGGAGSDSFKKEFVAFAAVEQFLTDYTVTASFHDTTASTLEARTSLVGKTITGAAVTALAPASGVDNKAALCTVASAAEGAKVTVTPVASDSISLEVTSVTTIAVTIASKSRIRIQAVYTDATGEDIDDLHVNDKVGIDANAELTVS